RKKDENDWHSAEDIRLLAAMAGLFHDFGKANKAFQNKLKSTSKKPLADAFRHEWVSLRLFEAFVGKDTDTEWLNRLASEDEEQPELEKIVKRDGLDNSLNGPFEKMPPLAQTIGWLVLSHHQLPTAG